MKANKVFIVIYIIIAIIVAYLTYGIVKDRYFTPQQKEGTPSLWEKFYQKDNGVDTKDSNEGIDIDDNMDEDLAVEEELSEFLEVTTEDCNNECVKFEEGDNKRYCKEICGLGGESIMTNSCDTLNGLEKDYCWKNHALEEISFEICQNIQDKNIKDSCQNRIIEELLNGSSGLE